MSYATGQRIKAPSEFFDIEFDEEYTDCEIVAPAPEDGVNMLDACYIVRRLSDGKEIVVCSDYFI